MIEEYGPRQASRFLVDSRAGAWFIRSRREGASMGRLVFLLLGALVIHAASAERADADLVDLAVGVHAGIHAPIDEDGPTGTVLGVRLRVLTPIPVIGIEGYYSRIGQEDAEEMWAQGDVGLSLDGDSFDVYGIDVLIGGVRGVPGFKWYGIVGVNMTEFDEGESGDAYRTGGEIGVGFELLPPAIGLGIEARGTLVALSWGDDPEPKFAAVTLGVNYYF
jgi:hypothetical protein